MSEIDPKVINALKWMVGIFGKHHVPYQIAGGFAARLYGATREIADIDFSIADEDFDKVYQEVKEYVIYGPEQYVDEEWDIKLMTLNYSGQEIDIAAITSGKFFDKAANAWVSTNRDLSLSEMKEIEGVTVSVIPKKALIAYKKKLMREVDIEDIQALL